LPEPNRTAAFDRARKSGTHLPSVGHQLAHLTALAKQVDSLPGAVERWTGLFAIRESAADLLRTQPARVDTSRGDASDFPELVDELMSNLKAIAVFG
jgi:hypothetical protein